VRLLASSEQRVQDTLKVQFQAVSEAFNIIGQTMASFGMN
jgi:hypothetical protein